MSLPGCFACLAEIDKTSYFTGFSYFGATGGHGGSLHFFSLAQLRFVLKNPFERIDI